MQLDKELGQHAEVIEKMKMASRGIEQNLIEKVDLARSLQDLSDERKEDLAKLTKKYEQQVSDKDKKLDELRLQLTSSSNQETVTLADMERLRKAHTDALSGKESEMQKLREQLIAAQEKEKLRLSLNEQMSQLKLEQSAALSKRDKELSDLRSQLEKAKQDAISQAANIKN